MCMFSYCTLARFVGQTNLFTGHGLEHSSVDSRHTALHGARGVARRSTRLQVRFIMQCMRDILFQMEVICFRSTSWMCMEATWCCLENQPRLQMNPLWLVYGRNLCSGFLAFTFIADLQKSFHLKDPAMRVRFTGH